MALGPRHIAPELLANVTKALGITTLEQWYHVSYYAASQAIGVRALNKFGGTVGFLKLAYPHHHFEEEKLTSTRYLEKSQKFLEVLIRKLFPNVEIQTKARKAVGIVNPETDAYLEIDFWMPSLKLGIEYQDRHHYEEQWYANDTLENYRKRDACKKVTMESLGYTLINIGFWWDRTLESVAATIRKVRPDLLQDYEHISAQPIPSNPPRSFDTDSLSIPGVAGLMKPYIPRHSFNPINWYAGEKQDGIRGVYHPELNKMFSRCATELSLLPCLLKDIPDMIVEGEIVAGRGNFNRTASVRSHTHHELVNWSVFRYVIFDIPDAELGNYIQRYSLIENGLSACQFVFAQSTSRVLVADKGHLKMLVDALISDGGEGVIVQKNAQYEYGRTATLAKIKLRRDADAQVLSINKLSCTCKLASGVTAEIGYSADFNPSSIEKGDIISYFHNGYSHKGLPKQAEVYRVRYDLPWEKLVSEEMQITKTLLKRRSAKHAIGGISLISRPKRNRMGYWNKQHHVRAFFEEFARNAGFEPLVAENWYEVKFLSVRNAGGSGILSAYPSLMKALKRGFPELKLKEQKFRTLDKEKSKVGHWNKPENVRAFFNEYARTSGFDPLVPQNWYSVRTRAVKRAGSGGLFSNYSFSLMKALKNAYPELKFQTEKFRTIPKMKARNKMGHWKQSSNMRAFLDEFAITSGFDPLVPNNWHLVSKARVHKAGGGGLLSANQYDLNKVLTYAYPELNFDKFRMRTEGTTRERTTACV